MNRFEAENILPELPLANLIVGESQADVAFFDALLTHRHVRDRCHLGYPNGAKKGKDGFGEYLLGLRTKLDRQAAGIRKILIVIDSDDDHDNAFTFACDRIREANEELPAAKQYPVPGAVRAASDGVLSITVATIPFDDHGCLETLLLLAADDGTHPLHACFDAYWQCVHFDRSRKNTESKQKLTTIIAASNLKNPSCSLGNIWSAEQRAGNPMRIDHGAFREFADFLQNFAT